MNRAVILPPPGSVLRHHETANCWVTGTGCGGVLTGAQPPHARAG